MDEGAQAVSRAAAEEARAHVEETVSKVEAMSRARLAQTEKMRVNVDEMM